MPKNWEERNWAQRAYNALREIDAKAGVTTQRSQDETLPYIHSPKHIPKSGNHSQNAESSDSYHADIEQAQKESAEHDKWAKKWEERGVDVNDREALRTAIDEQDARLGYFAEFEDPENAGELEVVQDAPEQER